MIDQTKDIEILLKISTLEKAVSLSHDYDKVHRALRNCYRLLSKENTITMQHKNTDYQPEKHDKFKALTVKNPYAHYIGKGIKTIEVRSQKTKYRGEIIICSSQYPDIGDMPSGCVICKATLYDCVKIKNLEVKEWDKTLLPKEEEKDYREHYGWKLRDIKPMVELPVKGNLGIWNLIMDKDEMIEYPLELMDMMIKEMDQDSKVERGKLIIKRIRTIVIVAVAAITLGVLFTWIL